MDFSHILTGIVFWLIISIFFLITFGSSSGKNDHKFSLAKKSPSNTTKENNLNDLNNNDNREEIINLQKQCQRLREELEAQSSLLKSDFRSETFEQLQPLLTNYPTARKMAKTKPDLPAKNLISLFTSLENLLENWGYETIGKPWEKVNYNPQIHQADSDDIEVGESVYIRFVGYRDGDNILYPAKVSLNLPPNLQS
ncbi:nucleotide exchange factor GrpE [Geminocystis sp. CENA526]|uniref:nucleotide exchange factor GrpE n=1 Tax=Geminocystis sp. CENA526 TaxID=1355871 RepID=UPI003D6EE7FF